jgi:hypothetical protein
MDAKTKKIFDRYDKYVSDAFSKDEMEVARERATMCIVDTNDLEKEVREQGGWYSYLGHMAIMYKARATKARMRRDYEKARIKTELRAANPGTAAKGGLGVDQLEALVQTNPVYIQCDVDLKNAEDEAAHIEADLAGYAQKGAMLRLLSDLVKRESGMKGRLDYGKETD